MDTLLKLSLNNEKDDEKNKEYTSVDFVWLYAYVKVRISPVSICPIFTARCYASAVLAMGLCLSVSVCLSQVGVLLKRLNVGSHKRYHRIAQGL